MAVQPSKVQLGMWDYGVFAITLFITALIASYRIFKDRVKNTKLDYFLFAGKTSSLFSIIMSSIATITSGIGLLAVPAEAYIAGIGSIHFDFAIIFVSLLTATVYLPVYYQLNIISVMEGIELRFNRVLRIIAAICYFLSQVMFNAVILHIPALALNQVTGIGIWECMAPMAIICTIYTALGGFKAVIWTDVFQALIMLATILLVMIKGLIDIGGYSTLWKRLSDGHRSTLFYLTPGPTVRYTMWTNYCGGIIIRLLMFTDQPMVQRQLASRTMESAKKSIHVASFGIFICSVLSGTLGLISYAKYFDCDPLLSGKITSRDQLAPYYVMSILTNFPGLGGFYIGGIVAATLSTLSSTINSLSLIAMQDFIKPFYGTITDRMATKLTKVLAAIIGMTSLAFVLVFQNFASAVEALHAAKGITGGPLLGMVTLGMLVPFASNLGATVGCIFGSVLVLWIIIGAKLSKIQPYAPLDISGCNETLSFNSTFQTSYSSTPYVQHNSSIFPLYTMSYQLYVVVGFVSTVIIGIIVSLVTGPQNPEKLPQGVIHHGIRKMFQKLPTSLKSKLGYRNISRTTNELTAKEEMMTNSKEAEMSE